MQKTKPSFLEGIFKASELEEIKPGETLPPPMGRREVSHLKSFEKLAKDLHQINVQEAYLAKEREQFEREIIEHRREFDEREVDLQFRRGTIEDQINQHIETVYPHARLVHVPPPEPDPDHLDVTVERKRRDNDD